MSSRPEIEALLCPIIEKHLPSASQKGNRDSPQSKMEWPRRSTTYAMIIKRGEVSGPEFFGFTVASVTLEEMLRSLRESQRLLSGLSGDHRQRLSAAVSPSNMMSMKGEPPSKLEYALIRARSDAYFNRKSGQEHSIVAISDVSRELSVRDSLTEREAKIVAEAVLGRAGLEQFEAALEEILSALVPLIKKHDKKKVASRKPNWQAATVTASCKNVWALENEEIGSPPWRKFCAGKGEKLDFFGRLKHFPPISQKLRPGPFGRFLEEIFEAFGILGKDGMPVSAMTALHSWKELSKQQI